MGAAQNVHRPSNESTTTFVPNGIGSLTDNSPGALQGKVSQASTWTVMMVKKVERAVVVHVPDLDLPTNTFKIFVDFGLWEPELVASDVVDHFFLVFSRLETAKSIVWPQVGVSDGNPKIVGVDVVSRTIAVCLEDRVV